jgi:D-glycero-D-manno-heptose 1,7-bisphosphate phosphatase
MKRAAVFFDRDNTLIVNDGYLGDPRGVTLAPGAADAVARARALGYAVVVFSNQSGVARGMFAEEAVHAVNHRLDEMLQDDNPHAVIDRHEFCPFHPEATVERYRQDSELRKPRPGMIHQAARQLALDLDRSWVVGDAPRDCDAGKSAGCRTILVKNGLLPESPAVNVEGDTKPDFEVESLAEAMEVIARHQDVNAPAAPPEAPLGKLKVAGEEAPVESVGSFTPIQPDVPREEPTAEAVSPAERSSHSSPTVSEPQPEIRKGRSKSEILLGQILDELKRRHEHPQEDFSLAKVLAMVVQVLAIGTMLFALIKRDRSDVAVTAILVATYLQALTVTLLIMGKQSQN